MRDRIRALSMALSIGFAVISTALGYWQVVGADAVLNRPTNPRLIEEDRRLIRGRILDRNARVLAFSQRVGELAQRSYSYPPLAHITGYVSTRRGKTGLEQAFDGYLRGARSADVLTAVRRKLFRPDEEGSDLVLTIDLALQQAADQALGDSTGAIVVVRVQTGEVLALASHPYFDPNTLDEEWGHVVADKARPLVSRSLLGQYVPGSVFKLVTASAAIDLGIATPEQRHHHEGDLIVQGFRIRNTNHPHLTDLSFAEEFAWSCNPAFALTGLSLGLTDRIDFNVLASPQAYVWPQEDWEASVRRLADYARRFGIGPGVPFDLPTAEGRIFNGQAVSTAQLASTAFGQGDLQVSPLQMALVAATIANGGAMPAPYLVTEAHDPRGSVAFHRPGSILRQVISPSAATALSSMMVLSVETAYAQPAKIPGVPVAGKTGTAEVGDGGAPHAWFVGYAPAERAGVAVAVIMENRGSGTVYAAPAGQKVLQAALNLGY